MKARAFLLMAVATVTCADEDGYDVDQYGSGFGVYGYDRERDEEPYAYIQNGPITMPTYRGDYGISVGSGSGKDFIGSTITRRGSCFSAYGITTCN